MRKCNSNINKIIIISHSEIKCLQGRPPTSSWKVSRLYFLLKLLHSHSYISIKQLYPILYPFLNNTIFKQIASFLVPFIICTLSDPIFNLFLEMELHSFGYWIFCSFHRSSCPDWVFSEELFPDLLNQKTSLAVAICLRCHNRNDIAN